VHAAPRTPAAGVLPGMPPAAPPAAAGVGITFRQLAEGGFVVVKVASGGPSDRQGVQPGDILTKVDRQEVRAHAFSRSPAHAVAARARSMHRPGACWLGQWRRRGRASVEHGRMRASHCSLLTIPAPPHAARARCSNFPLNALPICSPGRSAQSFRSRSCVSAW
jgi:hypothetical protein